MKKLAFGIATAIILMVGGAVAYASIPGPDGTIHACYKTSNPGAGALIAIDSAASCPSGFTTLNWNQTGPQGPAGPAGASAEITYITKRYDINTSGLSTGSGYFKETVTCPTGKHALNGGLSSWIADNSLPPEGEGGLALEESYDHSLPAGGAEIDPATGRYRYALPRPVDNDESWRLSVFVSLPVDYSVNPPVRYPIDVTYFVACG